MYAKYISRLQLSFLALVPWLRVRPDPTKVQTQSMYQYENIFEYKKLRFFHVAIFYDKIFLFHGLRWFFLYHNWTQSLSDEIRSKANFYIFSFTHHGYVKCLNLGGFWTWFSSHNYLLQRCNVYASLSVWRGRGRGE